MRKLTVAAVGWALAGLMGSATVAAQNLEMAAPPATTAPASVPTRGMTMAQVEQKFGAPTERHAPVGQPPISRWVYPDKVVYFEYDHVVHTVLVRP